MAAQSSTASITAVAATAAAASELPRCVVALDQALREQYTSQSGTEHLNASEEGEDYKSEHVPIKDLFVNLRMLSKSQLQERAGNAAAQGSTSELERMAHSVWSTRRGKPVELSSMLRLAARKRYQVKQRRGARILALGVAGVGKTTAFSKEAALKWAERKIWRNIRFLFTLPLRQPEIRQAKRLEDLLCLDRFHIYDSNERVQLLEFINANREQVCFILDGLDEATVEGCSQFVKDLMAGTYLDGVRLIATSRPSSDVLHFAAKNTFNRRVEVLGFSSADVQHYIRKALSIQHADEVLKQVECNPALATFVQIPVNAVGVCKLYRAGVRKLPTTLASLTSATLFLAIQQCEKKKDDPAFVDAKCTDWKQLASDLSKPAADLAEFAYKTLIDQVFIFNKGHFKQYGLTPDARSLGLLTTSDYVGFANTPQWMFNHLSDQESLAALHIAPSLTTAADVTCLVHRLGPLSGHLNSFWRFLSSQLASPGVDALIVAILSERRPAPEQTPPHSAAEQPPSLASQSAALSQSDFPISTRLGPVSGLLNSFRRFLSSQLASPISTSSQPDITAPKLITISCEESRQRLLLACHCYSEHYCSRGTAPSLPNFRRALEKFGGLDFLHVRLTAGDCSAIGRVLQDHHNVISEVNLVACRIHDIGYKQLSDGELSLLCLLLLQIVVTASV